MQLPSLALRRVPAVTFLPSRDPISHTPLVPQVIEKKKAELMKETRAIARKLQKQLQQLVPQARNSGAILCAILCAIL